jgi:hypothetical protein
MPMQNAAADTAIKNLIEALNRLQADLDRVEVWTAALISFQEAPPDYQPHADYVLPPGDMPH